MTISSNLLIKVRYVFCIASLALCDFENNFSDMRSLGNWKLKYYSYNALAIHIFPITIIVIYQSFQACLTLQLSQFIEEFIKIESIVYFATYHFAQSWWLSQTYLKEQKGQSKYIDIVGFSVQKLWYCCVRFKYYGNDLVLSGNKSLPEPMLTQMYATIYHH